MGKVLRGGGKKRKSSRNISDGCTKSGRSFRSSHLDGKKKKKKKKKKAEGKIKERRGVGRTD